MLEAVWREVDLPPPDEGTSEPHPRSPLRPFVPTFARKQRREKAAPVLRREMVPLPSLEALAAMTSLALPRPASQPEGRRRRKTHNPKLSASRPATASPTVREEQADVESPGLSTLGCPRIAASFATPLDDDDDDDDLDEEEAPPRARLTHWRVPRDKDYLHAYCSACHFDERDRCSYCTASKFSRVRRMHMERVAHVALRIHPQMCARDLASALAQYGRSDDFAADFNFRSGYRPPESKFCEPHLAVVDETTEQLRAAQREVSELRRELDEQSRETVRLQMRCDDLALAAETAGSATRDARLRAASNQRRNTEARLAKLQLAHDRLSTAVQRALNAKTLSAARAALRRGAETGLPDEDAFFETSKTSK